MIAARHTTRALGAVRRSDGLIVMAGCILNDVHRSVRMDFTAPYLFRGQE